MGRRSLGVIKVEGGGGGGRGGGGRRIGVMVVVVRDVIDVERLVVRLRARGSLETV